MLVKMRHESSLTHSFRADSRRRLRGVPVGWRCCVATRTLALLQRRPPPWRVVGNDFSGYASHALESQAVTGALPEEGPGYLNPRRPVSMPFELSSFITLLLPKPSQHGFITPLLSRASARLPFPPNIIEYVTKGYQRQQ